MLVPRPNTFGSVGALSCCSSCYRGIEHRGVEWTHSGAFCSSGVSQRLESVHELAHTGGEIPPCACQGVAPHRHAALLMLQASSTDDEQAVL